jgi:catechol 2,3-dioxygenase
MRIMELGHIVLYVTNVERSADFYRDTLGFKEIKRENGIALFGSGRNHHELLLIEVGGNRKEKVGPEPGLYHFGLKIGDSPKDIKMAYKEIKSAGVKIVGTADHYITHSLYIEDPDGNEIELYADVNNEWKKDPEAILKPVKPLNLKSK